MFPRWAGGGLEADEAPVDVTGGGGGSRGADESKLKETREADQFINPSSCGVKELQETSKSFNNFIGQLTSDLLSEDNSNNEIKQ